VGSFFFFDHGDRIVGVEPRWNQTCIGVLREGFGFEPLETFPSDHESEKALLNATRHRASIYRSDGLWIFSHGRGGGIALFHSRAGNTYKKIAVAGSGSPQALAEWGSDFLVAYTIYHKRSLHLVRVNPVTRGLSMVLELTALPAVPAVPGNIILFHRQGSLWLAYPLSGAIHRKKLR
jgi:hypothetical protein